MKLVRALGLCKAHGVNTNVFKCAKMCTEKEKQYRNTDINTVICQKYTQLEMRQKKKTIKVKLYRNTCICR